MVTGSVKKHKIRVITKRKVEKDTFGTGLEGVTDISILKEDVRRLIDEKGRVYGLYDKKKNLVAIYLFERINDFFVENGKSEIQIAGKKVDISDKWFGESKAAYRLVTSYLADVSDENRIAFENGIQSDLKEQIELGQIGGVQWKESILYRKNIDKSVGNRYWMGYLLGGVVGFMFGYLLLDSVAMGICFGATYALLGATMFSSKTGKEDRWNKIDLHSLIGTTDSGSDFVNPKYRECESNTDTEENAE